MLKKKWWWGAWEGVFSGVFIDLFASKTGKQEYWDRSFFSQNKWWLGKKQSQFQK